MKKQYISPIIEFHPIALHTFMDNAFSDNEPDAKERGFSFEENFEDENFEDKENNLQMSLW